MAVFKPESVRKNKESSTLLLKGENMNTFILGVDFFSKIKEIKDLNFEGIIEGSVNTVILIGLALIVLRIGKLLINKIFIIKRKGHLLDERRDETIKKLLQNILNYIVWFIIGLTILNDFGVNVKGLLAGAGILGVAIGFGAQSLVTDVITGFFNIFEDQLAVGDYVRINNFEGTVLQVGLRVTTIRGITGEIHMIPNGNILEITNFSIENSIALIDISVAYEENLTEVEKTLEKLLQDLPKRYEEIIGEPKLLGVQSLGPSEVIYRISCETEPMKHFQLQRKIRKDIKDLFEKYNIEIPYPRMVYYEKKNEKRLETEQEG